MNATTTHQPEDRKPNLAALLNEARSILCPLFDEVAELQARNVRPAPAR